MPRVTLRFARITVYTVIRAKRSVTRGDAVKY